MQPSEFWLEMEYERVLSQLGTRPEPLAGGAPSQRIEALLAFTQDPEERRALEQLKSNDELLASRARLRWVQIVDGALAVWSRTRVHPAGLCSTISAW